MSDFIMQLESVMRTELKGLDAVSHNSANAMTPGYRSRYPMFAPGLSNAGALRGPASENAIVNRDGALEVTGVKTDFALRGEGWFAVETPDGTRLTRDGRFRITEEGVLVDHAGNAVLSDAGPFQGLNSDISVMADGSIWAQQKQLGRLWIAVPENTGDVEPAEGGLYRSRSELTTAATAVVVQGAFEGSNVDMGAEMLRLMQSSRHIESVQRAISAYDAAMGTGINQLGK